MENLNAEVTNDLLQTFDDMKTIKGERILIKYRNTRPN